MRPSAAPLPPAVTLNGTRHGSFASLAALTAAATKALESSNGGIGIGDFKTRLNVLASKLWGSPSAVQYPCLESPAGDTTATAEGAGFLVECRIPLAVQTTPDHPTAFEGRGKKKRAAEQAAAEAALAFIFSHSEVSDYDAW